MSYRVAQKIINFLQKNNKKISTAESITGGRIAAALTSISESSHSFMGGVVCYTEHSKIHSAGVDVRDLKKYGVYSPEVVSQMAERILKRNISDISLAITGCAEGVCEGIATGEVRIAVAQKKGGVNICTQKFSGSREEIQRLATDFALQYVLDILQSS